MHQHSFSVIISQALCLASFSHEKSFQKGLWLLDARRTITGTAEEWNERKREVLAIHLTFSFGVCLETRSNFREQDESLHPLSFPLYLTNRRVANLFYDREVSKLGYKYILCAHVSLRSNLLLEHLEKCVVINLNFLKWSFVKVVV